MSDRDRHDQVTKADSSSEGLPDGGIAIIGMSGRFPGAPSVNELWKMISEGRDAFRKFAPEEIEDAFTDAERADDNYVAVRPHLDRADMFDAEFFGMFPMEAAATDPQHRIFLEICWEALECAGCDPSSYAGMVGVFAGASMPTYLINNVLSDRAKAEDFTSNYQVGTFNQLVGSLGDTLATRVAYKLNLSGPAFTVQSACSTSLLAVAQACQNLLTYSCDMALAGGISVTFPQKRGYMYQEGGMVSADGICRPFDANAAGTVFSSGAGVVVLKRFEDALRDEDRIYAVIRGYGVNNDGSNKVGFAAPSVEGQADAIISAMANAGVDPSTIGYLECHGTATPLGDPIEYGGLKNAFVDIADMRRNCALGSLKGNVGHMDAAAGVGGLIKAALALQHARIPGMANYANPNPRMDLDAGPFYIPTEMADWPASATPRRAGVSSFGVGGTNVHVVLEEAPAIKAQPQAGSVGPYILPLSARNNNALSDMRANLAEYLGEQPDISLPQLALTLQKGRKEFGNRLAISASNVEEAIERLRADRLRPLVAANSPPPIAFMFPGQGAQYVGMGAALYGSEAQFAQWIDRGAELVKLQLGLDLRDYICHTGAASQTMADELRDTRIAQPCLYLVEYALARMWLSRGVKPFAMIGHSVGEFVAATVANVISFEDALPLVVARGRLMQQAPEGAMVSVRADVSTVSPYLQDGVEIAAINAAKLCVISGSFTAIDAVCALLAKAEIAFSRLFTSHAFHSKMMDEAAEALRDETARVTYGTATIPYISGLTGDWHTGESSVSPEYWARQCRETVQFSNGLLTLCRDRKPVLMEIGPGQTLSTFALQTVGHEGIAAIVQTLPEHDRAGVAAETHADAAGKLWMAGCEFEWPALGLSSRMPLSLPTYPFQRNRHWIDAPVPVRRATTEEGYLQQITPGYVIVPEVKSADETNINVAILVSAMNRIRIFETSLLSLLSEMSGETFDNNQRTASFLELGFDSLFIGQFAQRIEKTYKAKLSFRELLSTINNVAELALHLDRELPAEAWTIPPLTPMQPVANGPQATIQVQPAPSLPQVTATIAPSVLSGFESVMQSQLQLAQSLFSQQFQMMESLRGGMPPSAPATAPALAAPLSTMALEQSLAGIALPPSVTTIEENDSGAAVRAAAAALKESAAALESVLAESVAEAMTALPQFGPLTEAQTEVWLAAQMSDGASCAFNESFSLILEGAFNETAFLKAIDIVVARHDALHIRFDRTGKQFEFMVNFKLQTSLIDLSAERDGNARLRQICEDEARNPFDLVNGPLVRTCIVSLRPEKHVFVFTAHHLICDGWSINVFIGELATAYSAMLAGQTPAFEPALSYASYSTDFAPKAEGSGKTEAFWLDCYKDIPELPELPLDRPRPERRTFAGGTRTAFIDAETYGALKSAGAKSGATLFSTLLATLQVMVSKLSGESDLVIALPSAGQTLIGDHVLMGHCVNLLPMRQNISSADAFRKHLKTTQQHVMKVYEHQDYTYGTLVRKRGIKRDPRRLPLTEILFNMERVDGRATFGSLKTSVIPNAKAFANFDMFFNTIEEPDGIRIDVTYNADVFDPTTIDRWINHFKTLAASVAKNMGCAIRELPMLDENDMNWIVNDLNQTASDYNHRDFAFSLFSRKVAEQPDATAVEFDGNRLTYKELDDKSNQLALYLQVKMPAQHQRVGLLVDRSLNMLVSLLAIMKAGHAYVPMDTTHPESRLRQTLGLVRMGGIICDSDLGSKLAPADMPVIRLDKEAKTISSMRKTSLISLPTDTTMPAYIILTSGSTGQPKGVEVSHRALTNFLVSMAHEPRFGSGDTIVGVTTISFDIAALEMYLPLISGGKVVIATKSQVQDGFALVELIEECGATVMQATPTLWAMMLEAGLGKNSNLKMLCGGEPLPKDLARSLLAVGSELWNMYGPTETTIWSSIARITDVAQPITIGHPIANTQLYILDADSNVAPVGVTGELHIGGDGLANGYFDRLDLTEKAFVPISLGAGKPKRLYKTGDVGRRLADGSLQLLGRRDQQIKLRGFRIELGDIESVVSKMEGVRQCAVVAASNEKSDKSLVCYIVPEVAGFEISAAALATYAKIHLPTYMVPTFWVNEEDLPRTQNGKLNRKNLEERGVPTRDVNATKRAPRNATEEKLILIWRDVLKIKDVGVDDSLYSLGVDSLAIFQLAARMIDARLLLEAKHLLRYPSVSELAKYIERRGDLTEAATQITVPSLQDFRNGARRGQGRVL